MHTLIFMDHSIILNDGSIDPNISVADPEKGPMTRETCSPTLRPSFFDQFNRGKGVRTSGPPRYAAVFVTNTAIEY